jgi:hypothetical protein
LVLDLPLMARDNSLLLSLARGQDKHGECIFDSLFAAKDNQIKILRTRGQRLSLPTHLRAWTPGLSKGWYRQGHVVSVHDKAAWKELKSIAVSANMP